MIFSKPQRQTPNISESKRLAKLSPMMHIQPCCTQPTRDLHSICRCRGRSLWHRRAAAEILRNINRDTREEVPRWRPSRGDAHLDVLFVDGELALGVSARVVEDRVVRHRHAALCERRVSAHANGMHNDEMLKQWRRQDDT
eukprot:2398067-Pleurochrysis_carterae.AAC.7